MRGQGRVFQRGPVWWIAYSHQGKEYRESTKSAKKADAVTLLTRRLAERDQGRVPESRQGQVQMQVLLDQLLTDMALRQVRSLAQALRYHAKPVATFFGRYPAKDVQEALIDRYTQQRLAQGKAPGTVNWELKILGQALRLGARRQQVARVPVIRRLPGEGIRQGFFEREEFLAVVAHLPAHLQGVAVFAYWTGWRRGELLSLEWRDVDLQHAEVRLRPENAKMGDWRTIALNPALLEVLRQRETLRVQGDRIISWVFHFQGRRLGKFDRTWKVACQKAGCPGKHFHDLRRTAVRNMIRAGVPDRVAMQVSGHKTRSMLDRYNIVNTADTAAALRRVQEHIAAQAPVVVPLKKVLP